MDIVKSHVNVMSCDSIKRKREMLHYMVMKHYQFTFIHAHIFYEW
jgi:hypothetical protein